MDAEMISLGLPIIPAVGPIAEMFPAIMIMMYIPFVCYSDLKSRTVPLKWWLPLIIVGTPFLYFHMLQSFARNWYWFGISLMFCAVLLCMALLHIIGGADFIFASLITLFMQANPFKYPRIFFAVDFILFMFLLFAFVPIVVWVYNRVKDNKYGNLDMFRKINGHFPMMLVISAAFFIELITELLW